MNVIQRIITYLGSGIGDASISHETPSTRNKIAGGETVTIARVGGPSSRFLDQPRITVDCYSESGVKAYELASKVAGMLLAMPDHDGKVSDVHVGSIYRNDWTEDGTPCYSVSASMIVNV